MKKVVITGADGFIGRYLVEKMLDEKTDVYAVGINPEAFKDNANPQLNYITLRFEDYQKMCDFFPKDIDVFYHFAWNGTFGEPHKDYVLQLNNARYTCDSILIAKKLNAKKFVLASTINTLETRYLFNKNNYDKPIRYTNMYAMAKLTAEMYCRIIASQNEMDFNVGLIAMVYGETNLSKGIPNIVMSNLIYQRESNLIEGDKPFDMIHVSDVATAFYLIGARGKRMETYYVGNREIKTFQDIFDEVKEIVNPNGIINYGVYKEISLIDYSIINTLQLHEDTGFTPGISLREGTLKTIKWLKESGEFR